MNRLFLSSFSLAVAAMMGLPAGAEAKDKKGGGGKPGVIQAPVRVAPRSAPRVSIPRQAAIRSAPAVRRSPSVAQMRARQNVAIQRNFAAQQRNVARQNAVIQRNVQRNFQRNLAVQRNNIARQNLATQRRFAQVQAAQRRTIVDNSRRVAVTRNNNYYYGNRGYRNPYYASVPSHVYRDWDRGREHWWNNHRYGWRGSSWVILSSYGYPYYDSYDDSPSVVVSTAPEAVGSSLAADVQSALTREGYDPGPVDGVLGSSTRDAITEYQADHGLAVTGTINSALLQSLGL